MERIATTCAIAGGGPAGLMLGYLLARAGVRVIVLEKHADFLRDFRGDTIHPSTLRVMDRLGELDPFLELPHQKFRQMGFTFGNRLVPVADFAALGARTGFVAMMPQWDFLNFVAGRAAAWPGFDLRMQARAEGLIESHGKVTGLRAVTPQGPLEIAADLVVAADGRHSVLRAASRLPLRDLGSPIDVLWLRLPRREGDPGESLGRLKDGLVAVLLNRGHYWQVALIIPKGGFAAVQARGLDAFRARLAKVTGLGPERAAGIADWEAVKLLEVRIDRLARWWKPGFLCIGDAAHAMSPVGGVGVNLAIQDAVAAANRLAAPLRGGRLTEAHLAGVQHRREGAVKLTQGVQGLIQNRLIRPALGSTPATPPLPLRLLERHAWLRRWPARFVGLGVRPELPAAGVAEAAQPEA